MWTFFIIIIIIVTIILIIFSIDDYFDKRKRDARIKADNAKKLLEPAKNSKTKNKRTYKNSRKNPKTIPLSLDDYDVAIHSKTDELSKHREHDSHHHFDSGYDSSYDGGSDSGGDSD